MSIRLVVIDARTLCRQGLARVVADQPDIEIVAEAATARRGVELVAEHAPDVVLLDARLPDCGGLEAVRQVKQVRGGVGVVMMASGETDGPMFDAMAAGASAFVSSSAPEPEFLAAIRSAAVAPSSFSAAGMAEALVRRRAGELLLSPRERQVLDLLAEGYSIVEIGRMTHLSHSTAKTYAGRLYEKLGAANRAQALMAAVRLGLVRQEDLRGRHRARGGPAISSCDPAIA